VAGLSVGDVVSECKLNYQDDARSNTHKIHRYSKFESSGLKKFSAKDSFPL